MKSAQGQRSMILAICLGGVVTPAIAQEEVDNNFQIQEITVTASRVQKSLQSTPIAVSAFTSESLNRSQIDSPEDLQLYTPGLVIADFGIPQIYIRGVGSNTAGVAVDPSATIYIDGVYLARTLPAFQDFIDVERVEVLRGPQGTLYGRNSTAGTINIISKNPTEVVEAQADALYGSYARFRLRGSVSGPLVEGKLIGRASLSWNKRDGIYDNVVTGKKLNDEDKFLMRGALELRATENLNIILRGDYAQQRETGGITKVRSTDAALVSAEAIFPIKDFDVAYDASPFFNVDNYGTSLDAHWEGDDTSFRSVSAWRHFKSSNFFDTDGTNLPLAVGNNEEKSDTYSQEIQISSNQTQRLTWIVGGFYLHDDAGVSGGTIINPSGIVLDPMLIPAAGVLSNFDPRTFLAGTPGGGIGTHDNKTNAYGVFGQTTFKATERFHITAGVRYSYETKSTVVDVGLGAVGSRETWDAITPRFVVEYFPNDEMLMFVSVAKGFKSGGFNLLSTTAFDPEYVWNYEAGIKGNFFDKRLQANLAAFYAVFKDFQIQTLDEFLQTQVTNAGKAKTKGIELELVALPASGLSLDASVAFLDAEYKNFTLTDLIAQIPVVFPPFGTINFPVTGQFDLANSRMFNAPKWTLTFGGQYTWDVNDFLDLSFRAEYNWSDKIRYTRNFSADSFGVVNARLSVEAKDSAWSIAIFGKNIFDEHYLRYGALQAPLWGDIVTNILGEPATWGIQAAFRY